MTPEPRSKRFLSLLGMLFLGLAFGGCLTGFTASPLPSPDASPDAGRLEARIAHAAANQFLIGLFLSLVAFSSRFLIGRNISKKSEPEL